MIRSTIMYTILLTMVLSITADGRGGPKWSGLNPSVEFFLEDSTFDNNIAAIQGGRFL